MKDFDAAARTPRAIVFASIEAKLDEKTAYPPHSLGEHLALLRHRAAQVDANFLSNGFSPYAAAWVIRNLAVACVTALEAHGASFFNDCLPPESADAVATYSHRGDS